MRKIRMLLFVVLFAALLTQCTQDALPTTENIPALDIPFADVSPRDSFYEPVLRAWEMGLMDSASETAFDPFGYLTRGTWVNTLFHLSGEEPGVPDFADVSESAPYAGGVGWAQQIGLVSGGGDGTFAPEAEITRQEFLFLTDRFLDHVHCIFPTAEDAAAPFVDQDQVEDWAAEAVEHLRTAGLVQGSVGRLQPLSRVNRAEAAALAVRIADQMEREPAIEPVETPGIGADIESENPTETNGAFRWADCSLYTAYPDFVPMGSVQTSIATHTGETLLVSEEAGPQTVSFTVDPSLEPLEYIAWEQDGSLTFAVCSPFALPYMDQIVEDFFAQNGDVVPADLTVQGSYTIDEAWDLPAGTAYSLVGETNKNPLAYTSGEDVTFRISLLQGNRLVSVPSFQYTYQNDDGITTDGALCGVDGQCVITVPGCTQPGTGRLTVKPVGVDGVEADYVGGVVFDFAQIAPAKPAPEDFKQFWEDQMAALQEIAPRHQYYQVCEAAGKTGYIVYDIAVSTPWGSANIHVSIPEGAAEHSLGIRMVYQAYGFTSAEPAYHENAITVSVNPHSILNDMTDEYYAVCAETLNCWVDEGDTLEDCYFLGMILRDVQALRYVEKQFADLWNGTDIDVSGHSMGAMQAIAVGALCPEVTTLALRHTWMCDLAGGDAGRIDSWAPGWSEAGQYFDPCYFAPYVHGTIRTMTAAMGDELAPLSGVIALYNALDTEKQMELEQNGRHNDPAGPYDRTYSIQGDPVSFDLEEIEIRNTGRAKP